MSLNLLKNQSALPECFVSSLANFAQRLVFVDGVFSEVHSSLGLLKNGALKITLANNGGRGSIALNMPNGMFGAVRQAPTNAETILEVKDGAVIEGLVALVNVTSENFSGTIAPRHVVRLGKSSRLDLVETFSCLGKGSFVAQASFDLAANAEFNYAKIQMQPTDTEHESMATANIKRDAKLHSVVVTCGAAKSQENFNVLLNETGADVGLYGLYAARDAQVVNHHTSVTHVSAATKSRQLYKGILNNEARAVFNGRVVVNKDAQKIESSQLNRNLLLSKKASVVTTPDLEIAANDVTCTHGATVGQISEEELFYLETRAIPREMAQKILVHAFADDILDYAVTPALRGVMAGVLENAFWTSGSPVIARSGSDEAI